MSPAEENAPLPEIVFGTGVIDAVMISHGMIDLTHDPIPALDWPVMSMSFFVLDPTVSLEGLGVGERVDFSLRQNADGQWRIASISGPEQRADPLIEGRGRVVTLMEEFNMVEIDHERIEAIDMPAMSMVYELAEGLSLEDLAVGDHVLFTIEEANPGQWVLTGFTTASGEHGGEQE